MPRPAQSPPLLLMILRRYSTGLCRSSVDERCPRLRSYLTLVANFDDFVSKAPATNVTDTVSYDGEHDVSFRRGDLTLKLSRQRADGDQFSPTLTATYQGRPAFSLTINKVAEPPPRSSKRSRARNAT